jgi:uncharacterized membrane protein
MTGLTLGATSTVPSHDVLYDVVLLAHILSALVGFGAVAPAGGYALVLRRPGPRSASVFRYYRPGVNWGGRILFLVPVFGFVLIGISHGAWSLSDGWITIGLALWAISALVAEMVLWPAERRLQQAVAEDRPGDELHRTCSEVAALAAGFVVVLVVATTVMVAKP